MTRYLVDGVHLNVEQLGDAGPERAGFILLHGFTGSAETWRPFAGALGANRRTFAIDLLGHGQSDAPADECLYRPERAIAQLFALFDQLDLNRLDILGYSMGGRMALQLAFAAPERLGKLILESASPGIADPAERVARLESDRALADAAEHDGIGAFVDRWERVPLFASQARLAADVHERQRDQRLHSNPRGLAGSLRGFGAAVPEPLWDRLSTLRVCTLVLAGELDRKYVETSRSLAHALPRSRLHVVPGAGHAVHLEQPATFERSVLDFLGD